MNGGPGRLPERLIFSTRDAEAACAFLQAREFRLEFAAGEAAHVDMRLNGVLLPGLYLGSLQYGGAAEIRTAPCFDDYRIAAPLRGRLAASVGRNEISCLPGCGFLISPTPGGIVRSQHNTVGLSIFLRGPAVRRHLEALLGEPPKAPLEFAPLVDLDRGYGASLRSYTRAAIADLDRESPLLSPITIGLFEQFLIVGLLLAHPHNYSMALERTRHSVAPRAVKRAIEFIEANLEAPIVLADIVAASGMPGRTLALHFRRFRETTPMRYLRDARLARVRAALQRAEPEESVTAIAMNWGFGHMGRFAGEYRKAFGETPSQTLGKRPPSRRL